MKASVSLFCSYTSWAPGRACCSPGAGQSQILDTGLWASLSSPKFPFLVLSPAVDASMLLLCWSSTTRCRGIL